MCVLVRNKEIARKRRGRGASRKDVVSGKRSACVRTAKLRVVWATGLKAVRTEELVMVEVRATNGRARFRDYFVPYPMAKLVF